jgi:hypothetical protein
MAVPLKRLEGRKFCVVFVKLLDAATERVQLQCLRGRASVDRGKVSVYNEHGAVFTLPSVSLKNIMPSDGSELLRDAEYFCFVRVDDSMELVSQDSELFL